MCLFPGCQRIAERNGYCFLHAVHFAGPKPKEIPKPIAKESKKKKEENKSQKTFQAMLDEWFEARVEEASGVCMNCGMPISSPLFVFRKATVAHVLPKRDGQFPSVALHPENSLELCTDNGCHGLYDRSWEDAAKMAVWPLAVEKFKRIYPCIASGEKKFIPDILLQEVETIVA